MSALIGSLIGGVLGVYLLAALWEWVLFKRVMNDPVAGKMLSVACAYLTASTLYSLSGSAAGFMPFLIYLPGALIVGMIGWRRGQKLRSAPEVDRELENTFS